MAKGTGKLTALRVAKAGKRGYLSDGGNLYLQVSATGAKSWVFRFRQKDGRLREHGLGSVALVSLAQAREQALAARKRLKDGVDPIEHSKATRARGAGAKTFAQAALAFIEAHRDGWANPKHVKQWSATLETYANPIIGALPVGAVDTEHVLRILQPLWSAKHETASRLRGRIENVLDYAIVRKWRGEPNPARWKGHLSQLLAAPNKVADVEHHAAMAFADVPAFLARLQDREAVAALALEVCILTAARTGEVLEALWPEIDFDAATWTIPKERMKAGREHRVPLSSRCVEILRNVEKLRRTDVAPGQGGGDFVFPGQRTGKPLSNMSMSMLLRRMGVEDVTVHGFRSAFRDWAGDRTSFPRELSEAAPAHVLGDKAEQAYRRGDALEKRRAMMDSWARFCAGETSAKVVKLRAGA